MLGSTTSILANLRERAFSFSKKLRYSAYVVAPMQRSEPFARAGFSKFDISSPPPFVAPAPTIVWISSIKTIASSCSATSSITSFRRFSKSPRYFVPAIIAPMSSAKICACFSRCGTSPLAIFSASPSTTAVLPTPASPTRIGLFFFRRLSVCISLASSFSRPMIGSILPSAASLVKFDEYLARFWKLLARDCLSSFACCFIFCGSTS